MPIKPIVAFAHNGSTATTVVSAFVEWTRDGLVRHPKFVGIRADKNARDVVREIPPEQDR